jgi:hypothetical protein
MATRSPVREVIVQAIELVQRHGFPVTPKTIRANIDVDGLTIGDANQALVKHINAQIPVVMKEMGLVITDTATRDRKPFADSTADELDEQIKVKAESTRYDQNRLAADQIVVKLLREKEKELGYEVYPGLFHDEIDRIYSMHGIAAPWGVAA